MCIVCRSGTRTYLFSLLHSLCVDFVPFLPFLSVVSFFLFSFIILYTHFLFPRFGHWSACCARDYDVVLLLGRYAYAHVYECRCVLLLSDAERSTCWTYKTKCPLRNIWFCRLVFVCMCVWKSADRTKKFTPFRLNWKGTRRRRCLSLISCTWSLDGTIFVACVQLSSKFIISHSSVGCT